jgi:hypothetical protein
MLTPPYQSTRLLQLLLLNYKGVPLKVKVEAVLKVQQVQVPERIQTPWTENDQPAGEQSSETVQESDKEEEQMKADGNVNTNNNMMASKTSFENDDNVPSASNVTSNNGHNMLAQTADEPEIKYKDRDDTYLHLNLPPG